VMVRFMTPVTWSALHPSCFIKKKTDRTENLVQEPERKSLSFLPQCRNTDMDYLQDWHYYHDTIR